MAHWKIRWRNRAPEVRRRVRQQLRFEGYPYLVSRIGQSALRHLALVPAHWSRERIVVVAQALANANRFETAACFGADDAVYFDCDGAATWYGVAPTGTFVTDRLLLREPLPQTAELLTRRDELEAFERAQNLSGYLIGDGTNHGPRATAGERARLGGRGPSGLPTGLRRCPSCQMAAGDYLRGGVEVIRIYCACENHNRCARCHTALAGHRLSAWFWDDADDQAWHLAAYAAFSHRCPDEQ